MGGYTVFGGESSAAVVTPELLQAGAAMKRVGEILLEASNTSGGTMLWNVGTDVPTLQSPMVVPLGEKPPSARLEQLRMACRSAWDAVGSSAGRSRGLAEELARDLVAAANQYEEAERNAISRISAQCSSIAEPHGKLALLMLLWGFKDSAPPNQRIAAEGLDSAVGKGSATRPAENGEAGEGRAAAIMAILAALSHNASGSGGAIAVGKPIPKGDTKVNGLPGLVDLQNMAFKGEDGSGAVLVTRMGPEADNQWTADPSQETWVVTVPGTNTNGDAVWGNARLPQAIGGDSRHVSDAVAKALDEVGVPEGARIVFNGHSQGGRHALNLANDPVLRKHYDIVGVVTSGAPSGNAPIPSGTTVVQLEDPDDSVPGLDGSTWVKPTDERFLVRAESSPAPQVAGKEPGLFGWEHKIGNYKGLAESVQADRSHPDLDAAVVGMGIGAGAATTARTWMVPTSKAKGSGAKKSSSDRN
jgi:pimeloyl-ACP methyl ester carboxylesterase